jgi:hypothetical protein
MYKCSVITILMLFGFTYSITKAQGSDQSHATYLEVWGNTGLWSLNYDYTFKNHYGFRLGLRGEPKSDLASVINSFGIISTANILVGAGMHKLELGMGGYLEIDQGSNTEDFFLSSTIGYRYQDTKSRGWIFRAGFTPTYNSSDYFTRFGISIGRVVY